MEKDVLYKFVFEDAGLKVLKGFVVEEDDYCFKIKPFNSENIIILGKRGLIKVQRADAQ